MLVLHPFGLVQRIDRSDRLAYSILGIMVALFVIIESHEIFEYENVYGAFEVISSKILPNCSYMDLPYNRGTVNWYLVCAGNLAFDNSRIMPFLISLGVIPVTFLMIRKYSNNFTALLVAGAIPLDLTFLVFDTIPAFTQTWTILFLGSVYFIRKSPLMAGSCFWLACLAKILAIAWLPIVVWVILKNRMRYSNLIAFLSIVPVFLVAITFFGGSIFYSFSPFVFDFTWDRVESSIQWVDMAFRWEKHLLVSIPVIFGYYIYAKRKGRKISITPYMVSLFGVLSVFLTAFFTNDGYFPYRLLPNIIMILYGNAYTIRHFINGKS